MVGEYGPWSLILCLGVWKTYRCTRKRPIFLYPIEGDDERFIERENDTVIIVFPYKPLFLCVYSTSLMKTLCEKEKLLVTNNFSFSLSVFYQFGKLSAIFRFLMTLKKKAIETIVGKGENVVFQHFPLFSQCFLLYHGPLQPLESFLYCHLQLLSIWTCLKFYCVINS